MKIRNGFVSNSSSSSFVMDSPEGSTESFEERIKWLENDLREAKRNIEDLQNDLDQIKHLLDEKGISF